MSRSTGNVGRHDLARVPEPAAGYSPLPSSTQNTRASIAIVAVPDPFEQQKRVRALCRLDLLDQQRRSDKLTEAAYQIGREVERVLECLVRIGGGGQFCEGDRVDAATQAEVRAILGIERAYAINSFLAWMARHIGRMDTRLLVMVLGDRVSISSAAVAFGRDGRRGYQYTIDRFRDALGVLAEAKSAKGKALR